MRGGAPLPSQRASHITFLPHATGASERDPSGACAVVAGLIARAWSADVGARAGTGRRRRLAMPSGATHTAVERHHRRTRRAARASPRRIGARGARAVAVGSVGDPVVGDRARDRGARVGRRARVRPRARGAVRDFVASLFRARAVFAFEPVFRAHGSRGGRRDRTRVVSPRSP